MAKISLNLTEAITVAPTLTKEYFNIDTVHANPLVEDMDAQLKIVKQNLDSIISRLKVLQNNKNIRGELASAIKPVVTLGEKWSTKTQNKIKGLTQRYQEDTKDFVIVSIERRLEETERKNAELQARISQLEAQMGMGGTTTSTAPEGGE